VRTYRELKKREARCVLNLRGHEKMVDEMYICSPVLGKKNDGNCG
jgi:hypothetical protein